MNRSRILWIAVVIHSIAFAGVLYAQSKTIVVGEGVRGAMYLPTYIAEERGSSRSASSISRSNDINALVSGDIQFNLTAPDKVIHSALGGFPSRW